MKIIVLIAGVHDPKWPVTLADGELEGDHQIMSPFDEAALEIALRIRDSHPDSLLHVYVAGGKSGSKAARAIAAFNPTEILTVGIGTPWDQSAVISALAGFCGSFDLVLIGREFGDFDDGLIPGMLAAKLGIGFFGRVQTVNAKAGLSMMREVGGFEERCTVSSGLLVSVTNDRRTRLRKPLMKNVMLARQAMIKNVELLPSRSPTLRLIQMANGNAARAKTSCAMIEGAKELQAQALASILKAVRA